MPKFLISISLFVCLANTAFAQFKYKVENKHVIFTTAYYGILDLPSESQKFRHGASIGVSYPLVSKHREKLQRKTSYNRIQERDVYLKMNVSHL